MAIALLGSLITFNLFAWQLWVGAIVVTSMLGTSHKKRLGIITKADRKKSDKQKPM